MARARGRLDLPRSDGSLASRPESGEEFALREIAQRDTVAGGLLAHPFEPVAEPTGGLAKRRLRIEVKPSAKRAHGEEQIAKLLFDPFGSGSVGDLPFQLAELLADLSGGPLQGPPVESRPRGPALDLRRACQRGKARGDVVVEGML